VFWDIRAVDLTGGAGGDDGDGAGGGGGAAGGGGVERVEGDGERGSDRAGGGGDSAAEEAFAPELVAGAAEGEAGVGRAGEHRGARGAAVSGHGVSPCASDIVSCSGVARPVLMRLKEAHRSTDA